jgi:hypothetical protein
MTSIPIWMWILVPVIGIIFTIRVAVNHLCGRNKKEEDKESGGEEYEKFLQGLRDGTIPYVRGKFGFVEIDTGGISILKYMTAARDKALNDYIKETGAEYIHLMKKL